MTNNFTIPVFFALIVGVYCLYQGIRFQQGYNKKYHYFPAAHYRAQAFFNLAIPIGIAFLMWALSLFIGGILFPDAELSQIVGKWFIAGGFIIIFIGWALMFFPKSIVHPAWVRWLQREHSDILDILEKEAKVMGLNVWEEHVKTQQGLEQWVDEVRRKYDRPLDHWKISPDNLASSGRNYQSVQKTKPLGKE